MMLSGRLCLLILGIALPVHINGYGDMSYNEIRPMKHSYWDHYRQLPIQDKYRGHRYGMKVDAEIPQAGPKSTYESHTFPGNHHGIIPGVVMPQWGSDSIEDDHWFNTNMFDTHLNEQNPFTTYNGNPFFNGMFDDRVWNMAEAGHPNIRCFGSDTPKSFHTQQRTLILQKKLWVELMTMRSIMGLRKGQTNRGHPSRAYGGSTCGIKYPDDTSLSTFFSTFLENSFFESFEITEEKKTTQRGPFPDVWSSHFPDFNTLPDDYNNNSHKVHIVNGHRVEVNESVHKNTGEGGDRSIHHVKTFIVNPYDGKVHTTDYQGLTEPQTEQPLTTNKPNYHTTKANDYDYIYDEVVQPEAELSIELDKDSNRPNHSFPQFGELKEQQQRNNNVKPGRRQNLSHALFRTIKTPSEIISNKDALLLKYKPNPNNNPNNNNNNKNKMSSYTQYNVDAEITSHETPPAPDLSSDININRIRTSNNRHRGGMIAIDPNSEIIDYPKVIESLKPLDDIK